MRVWIDQDLCTGDGLCVDHCPDVFVQLEDGIAYVAENGDPLNDPGGSGSLAVVAARHVGDVIHAAETCPGECIFIEIDMPELDTARSDSNDPATDVTADIVDEAAA
jgi:ferredoxin